MADVFSAKLRKIGSSVGILIPKEQAAEFKVGDEVEFSVLKHRDIKDVERGFGASKHFKFGFERDKKTRGFA